MEKFDNLRKEKYVKKYIKRKEKKKQIKITCLHILMFTKIEVTEDNKR